MTTAQPAQERTEYRPGYEIAAERILAHIAENGLAAGDRLPTEIELAGMLGVSRTVTREAVKILSALGRIRAHKGRGLYVADDPGLFGSRQTVPFMPTDIDQVLALFEFRRVQEVEISRLAATRATPVELRAIGQALKAYQEAEEHGDKDQRDSADAAFHDAIVIAAHNPFLLEADTFARRLQYQTSVITFSRSGTAKAARAEHEAIYEAIKAGDPVAAAAATAAHIDRSTQAYRTEIQRRISG